MAFIICEKFYFEIKTNHRNSFIYTRPETLCLIDFIRVASFFTVSWHQFYPILKKLSTMEELSQWVVDSDKVLAF